MVRPAALAGEAEKEARRIGPPMISSPILAILRVAFVIILVGSTIATLVADPYLRRWAARVIANPLLVDATCWAVRLTVWALPVLVWRRFLRIGSFRLPPTRTVFLVLPYLLLNVAFFRGFPAGYPVAHMLCVALAVATWEELAFRGYALAHWEVHPPLAILVSALGFTFLHWGFPPASLVTVFFAATAFGIVRVISGSLGWCILIHALTNFLAEGAKPPDWAVLPVAVLASAATLSVLLRHPNLRKKGSGISQSQV